MVQKIQPLIERIQALGFRIRQVNDEDRKLRYGFVDCVFGSGVRRSQEEVCFSIDGKWITEEGDTYCTEHVKVVCERIISNARSVAKKCSFCGSSVDPSPQVAWKLDRVTNQREYLAVICSADAREFGLLFNDVRDLNHKPSNTTYVKERITDEIADDLVGKTPLFHRKPFSVVETWALQELGA